MILLVVMVDLPAVHSNSVAVACVVVVAELELEQVMMEFVESLSLDPDFGQISKIGYDSMNYCKREIFFCFH